MKYLVTLAARSAWNRRATLALVVLSIALSVTLLLGVERLRSDVRESFAQSVSGTDLVVGARGSPLQLMLYTVFHLGEASSNMDWASVQKIAAHPAVAWAIPLSLGDSHHGYPVVATDQRFFEHFHYGEQQALRLDQGRPFQAIFETVLGAEVAEQRGYRLGERIALSHGGGDSGLAEHADKPFTVVGILARTGTPVDRTLHINLQAMEAIHLDWQGGARIPGLAIPEQYVSRFDLTPKSVTGLLLGLKSRAAVFAVQRQINNNPDEPLMAVLPGVALAQLWQMLSIGEQALLAVSALVVVVGLAGLVAVILAGLNERRRELAILRSVGAGPRHVLALLSLEGLALTLCGALLGLLLLSTASLLLAPWLESRYGLALHAGWPSLAELRLLAWVVAVGSAASLLPGLRAYRLSLSVGLTPRV
jgi:putative ABC transport system permease protein